MNSFVLPSFGPESRKRFALRLLRMGLEDGGRGRKLFCLGEQKIWLRECLPGRLDV